MERFLRLPFRVIDHCAWTTLAFVARCVLLAVMGQFRGRNNGTLPLTEGIARGCGVPDSHQLYRALRELEARGLIVCTRRGSGGGPHKKASLYAVTWLPIDPPDDKNPHEAEPTNVASYAFESWSGTPNHWGWTIPSRRKTLESLRRLKTGKALKRRQIPAGRVTSASAGRVTSAVGVYAGRVTSARAKFPLGVSPASIDLSSMAGGYAKEVNISRTLGSSYTSRRPDPAESPVLDDTQQRVFLDTVVPDVPDHADPEYLDREFPEWREALRRLWGDAP